MKNILLYDGMLSSSDDGFEREKKKNFFFPSVFLQRLTMITISWEVCERQADADDDVLLIKYLHTYAKKKL